jgi:hypothetical protein
MTGINSGPAGVMGQPAIQKQPAFLLQGTGERVLDKKKLDELVRQVTGGSGEGLGAEVEEVSSAGKILCEYNDILISSPVRPHTRRRIHRQRHNLGLQTRQTPWSRKSGSA